MIDEFENDLPYDFKNVLISDDDNYIVVPYQAGGKFDRNSSVDAGGYFGWASRNQPGLNLFTASATPSKGDMTYTNTVGTQSGSPVTDFHIQRYERAFTFNRRAQVDSVYVNTDGSLTGTVLRVRVDKYLTYTVYPARGASLVKNIFDGSSGGFINTCSYEDCYIDGNSINCYIGPAKRIKIVSSSDVELSRDNDDTSVISSSGVTVSTNAKGNKIFDSQTVSIDGSRNELYSSYVVKLSHANNNVIRSGNSVVISSYSSEYSKYNEVIGCYNVTLGIARNTRVVNFSAVDVSNAKVYECLFLGSASNLSFYSVAQNILTVSNCRFMGGNSYLVVGTSATSGTVNIRNVTFCENVGGESSVNKLTIMPDSDKDYSIVYKKADSEEVLV